MARKGDALTPTPVADVVLDLDADEYAALTAMRTAGGFHSDADTVRAALWKYGLHFDMDLPIAVFRLRDGKPTVRTKR